LKKDKLAVLEKGQYTLTFLFLIMGIAFLQATLNAIAPGLTFFGLSTIHLIHHQIAVRVWNGMMALITLYLT
jgi:hypothetical protein